MGLMAGIASGLAGQAGAAMFGDLADDRQYNQQKRLQELQIKGSKEMADYQNNLMMKNWEATNFEAQRKQLEKAGMSASLMYSGGGQGGSTASAGASSPSGASADGASTRLMAGVDMARSVAEIENIKANTKKTEIEANKTAGVDTNLANMQIANLTQGIQNQKAVETLTKVQEEIANLDLTIKNATFNDALVQTHAIAHSAHTTMQMLQNEKQISDATVKQKIDLVNTELAGALLNNLATQQGIEKSKAEINKMAQDILQGWEKLKQSGEEVNIKNFEAKIRAEYPNYNQIIGKAGNDFFEALMGIFGQGFKPKK